MKKIIIFSVLAFVFLSCKNEVSDLQSTQSNLSDKIGIYHNKALELYFENTTLSGSNALNYDSVKTKIIDLLVKSDSTTFKRSDIALLEQKSKSVSLKSNVKFGANSNRQFVKAEVTDNFQNIVNYLNQNGEISDELSLKLSVINDSVKNENANRNEILSLVNQLKDGKWSDKDTKYVNAFVQVYNNSYSYWTNKASSVKSGVNGYRVSQKMKESSVVILADGAGALYGLILGPVWSIIEGAIFSVIADNQD